ncbi:hypothetical protein [Shigella sonnei]|uniref:Uncharacterized protein n=9 Tax=Enterobacteriaceae TaxID=543 RepID=A0A023UFV6_ECOLX|nr:hypothetical protein [Shigella sonnei]AHX99704.1 hypothetical protein orf00135 [Escherichia coli]EFU32960.1 hypothetical protein HMPREF9350_05206 [Escherichia coli MS 85-1]QAX88865.1 hypothetical protein EcMB_16 [Escherichia coli]QBP89658.1 hypothetical protein FORC81_p174 [Escherichia coli]BEB60560.1 hypothetical protein VEE39_47030 [Escherichia coli]
MAIAKYMQIRKIQNAFGIFQKSVDSLLCGEAKIGERIPQTITIAMVNLTRKNMVNIVNLHDKRERGNKENKDGNKRLN